MIDYFADKKLAVFTNLTLWPHTKRYFECGHHYLLLYFTCWEKDPKKYSDILIRFDINGKTGTVPMTVFSTRPGTIVGYCDLGSFTSEDSIISVYSYKYDGVEQIQDVSTLLQMDDSVKGSWRLIDFCGETWPVFTPNYYICTCGQICSTHSDQCIACGKPMSACREVAKENFSDHFVDRYMQVFSGISYDANMSYNQNIEAYAHKIVAQMPFLNEPDVHGILTKKCPQDDYEVVSREEAKKTKAKHAHKTNIVLAIVVAILVAAFFLYVLPETILFPKAAEAANNGDYETASKIYGPYSWLFGKENYHNYLLREFRADTEKSIDYGKDLTKGKKAGVFTDCEEQYWTQQLRLIRKETATVIEGCSGDDFVQLNRNIVTYDISEYRKNIPSVEKGFDDNSTFSEKEQEWATILFAYQNNLANVDDLITSNYYQMCAIENSTWAAPEGAKWSFSNYEYGELDYTYINVFGEKEKGSVDKKASGNYFAGSDHKFSITMKSYNSMILSSEGLLFELTRQ